MSFKSLVNKLVKEGKSREAATKIAGKVANAKMKGAGSGPTAKQKARMKGSPAKADWKVVKKSKGAGGRKSKEVYKDGKLVKSKSKAGKTYTNSGEYKTVTKEKLGKGSDKYNSKSTRKVKGGVYTQKDKVVTPKRRVNRTIKEINTTSKRNKGTETYVKEKRKETITNDKGSTRKTKVKLGSYVNKGTGKRASINKSKEKTTPVKRKVTKSKKTYSLGKTTGEMVAKKKTVTKKDGSVKTVDKYKTKGGGKGKTKSRVVEKMESAAGGKTTIKSKTRNKRYSSKAIPKKRVTKIEGTKKYNVGPDKMTEFKTTSKTIKQSPTKMKKQGYNARLDDSLGAKHGKKSQSLKSRRDESEGMEKSMKRRKFSGNKSSAQGSAAKFNKGLKKASADGKLDNNPKFKAAVDASPAKQIDPPKKQKAKGTLVKSTKRQKISGTKTVSPKKGNYLTTELRDSRTGKVTSRSTKPASTKKITYEQYEGLPHKEAANARAAQKMGYMMNYNTGQYEPTPNKRGAERRKESGLNRFQAYDQMDTRNAAQTAGSPMGMYGKHSPANAYGKSPMKMAHGKSPMKMKAKGGCAISKHMGGRIGGRR